MDLVPSHPLLPPEASSHGASVLGVNPHSQDQTSPMDQDPERAEGKVYVWKFEGNLESRRIVVECVRVDLLPNSC